MSDRCPWWIRWHHRNLRDVDRLVMWPALKAAVQRHNRKPGTLAKVWARYIEQPGQEHWHCPCALEEWRENLLRELESDG